MDTEFFEELRDYGRLVGTKYLNVLSLGSNFEQEVGGNRKSLIEMVRKLNTQKDTDVLWQANRHRQIVVRALKVMQLDRSELNNASQVNSVSRTEYFTIFRREFPLIFNKDSLVQEAFSDAAGLNDQFTERYNQAMEVLAANITEASNVLETRYRKFDEQFGSAIQQKVDALKSETDIRREFVVVSRCLSGFTLATHSNVTLQTCKELYVGTAAAVGFNYYDSNSTSPGECELKKPITGHKFSQSAVETEGCNFYYKVWTIFGLVIYIF